jgi:uncharacterized protein YggU (UPF0235/DUF167 family)
MPSRRGLTDIADANPKPWKLQPDATATLVRFRLTPKSSRDQIGAVVDTADGPAIAAHVRAVPESGGANRALIALVAKWLGVPKSTVELTTGAKSRIKTLKLCAAEADVIERLENHCRFDEKGASR